MKMFGFAHLTGLFSKTLLVGLVVGMIAAPAALGERQEPLHFATSGVSQYGSLDPWAYNVIHQSKYGSLDPWAYNAIQNAKLTAVKVSPGDSRSLDPTPEQLLAAGQAPAPIPSIVSVEEGFNWGDAGVGAGGAVSLVLLIGGTALVVRRRGHLTSA